MSNSLTNYTMRRSQYDKQADMCAKGVNPIVNPFPATFVPSIFSCGAAPHSWPPEEEPCECSTAPEFRHDSQCNRGHYTTGLKDGYIGSGAGCTPWHCPELIQARLGAPNTKENFCGPSSLVGASSGDGRPLCSALRKDRNYRLDNRSMDCDDVFMNNEHDAKVGCSHFSRNYLFGKRNCAYKNRTRRVNGKIRYYCDDGEYCRDRDD